MRYLKAVASILLSIACIGIVTSVIYLSLRYEVFGAFVISIIMLFLVGVVAFMFYELL